MRAGKLNKRIRIESQSSTQSGSGEPANVWNLFAVLYASIESLSGRELQSAQATYAEATHSIMLRYYPGITPAMRINHGGRLMNIGAVLDPSERRRQLTLLCSEGLNDG